MLLGVSGIYYINVVAFFHGELMKKCQSLFELSVPEIFYIIPTVFYYIVIHDLFI